VKVRRKETTRLEDNIKMDFREVDWGGMDWTGLAEGREAASLAVKNVFG
jgi:hypothetical protein